MIKNAKNPKVKPSMFLSSSALNSMSNSKLNKDASFLIIKPIEYDSLTETFTKFSCSPSAGSGFGQTTTSTFGQAKPFGSTPTTTSSGGLFGNTANTATSGVLVADLDQAMRLLQASGAPGASTSGGLFGAKPASTGLDRQLVEEACLEIQQVPALALGRPIPLAQEDLVLQRTTHSQHL